MEGLIGRGKNFRALNSLVAKLGITTNSLIADELKVQLESPVQKARTREAIKRVLIGGVAFNIVLAFVLATYFSRSVTKRLLIVRENTERLARRAELVPAIGGVDEIADLDAAFHKAADRLEELEQFKQQLIGIVSHELKTPLSSMQVNIALMREGATGELPDKAQNKVRVLESNVGRLIRLINDLLDIEKLESGKFELILRECKLKNIVETSLDATSEFASRRKIEIVAPVTDLVLHADQDRIVQVLINFLSNAVKYSAEGSQVVVDVAEVEDLVEVRVKDSGRGIPATHIEKIFDRFQQVEKTDETEKGGTGLGLAISKAIIEQHPGGKIGVDSKLGEGSTFWFRVKKWKAEEIVEALQVVAG
jgi:signal transduction histidine kinase